MALSIKSRELDEIREHASREYPNECCGVLLGVGDGEAKEVRAVEPVRNLRTGSGRAEELLPLEAPERESERNRFLIDPEDLRRVEKEARARGIETVGFYHSHPDHPAKPSAYDREHAFPWYSYVIISVQSGRVGPYASWVLRDDRTEFDGEILEVLGQEAREGIATR